MAWRFTTALLSCTLGMGWTLPGWAQSPSKSPADGVEAESLATRSTLGGDWGGLRGALGQHGIRADLWATGFYQDVLQGPGSGDGRISGRLDLMVNGDTATPVHSHGANKAL